MHRKAQVGTWQLQPGSVVLLEAEAEDEDAQEPPLLFGLVQCMWEDEDGEALAQVRGAIRESVLLCVGFFVVCGVGAVMWEDEDGEALAQVRGHTSGIGCVLSCLLYVVWLRNGVGAVHVGGRGQRGTGTGASTVTVGMHVVGCCGWCAGTRSIR